MCHICSSYKVVSSFFEDVVKNIYNFFWPLIGLYSNQSTSLAFLIHLSIFFLCSDSSRFKKST